MTRTRLDIVSRTDIELLIRTFYGCAIEDPLLGPIFVDIAHLDLEAHLPTMCDFWETVLFRAGTYRGNAMRPHYDLHQKIALTHTHFDRWLHIWRGTVDDLFAGEHAEFAKLQAEQIARSMHRRLARQFAEEPLSIQVRGS